MAEAVPGFIEVYWGSGWTPEDHSKAQDPSGYMQCWKKRLQTALQTRAGRVNSHGTQYVLLDDAQATYWDLGFWIDFIKPAQNTRLNRRVVLFCRYSNPSTSNGQGHLPVIGPFATISIQPPKQTQMDGPTLLLTRNEYNELLRNWRDPLLLDERLRTAIYDWTSGHAGAIHCVLDHISKQVGYTTL